MFFLGTSPLIELDKFYPSVHRHIIDIFSGDQGLPGHSRLRLPPPGLNRRPLFSSKMQAGRDYPDFIVIEC